MRFWPMALALGLGVLPPAALAQRHKPSYSDLVLVRNRRWAKPSFIEVRAGAVAGFAGSEDAARLAEDEIGPEGHVYIRQQKAFGRDARFDGYVGTDGAYVGLTEGDPQKTPGYSRLELFGRQWGHFIREGFYTSDDFVVVGSYRATDWRARLSFATRVSDTLRGEISGFYGRNSFDEYSKTDTAFTIPDDYSAYGVTLTVEDNTVQFDRQSLLPYRGYVLTAWITREWNDSDRLFGIVGRESSLPSAVLRGGAHLDWYLPYTNSMTFIATVDGAIAPEDDRIWIYDASKPVGEIWVDGRLDLRLLLGGPFTFTPGVRAQWVRIDDQFATTTDDKFFFGAQTALRADFSENFALALEYSFLNNESRRPVSLSNDSLGEHRLWFGFEFRP